METATSARTEKSLVDLYWPKSFQIQVQNEGATHPFLRTPPNHKREASASHTSHAAPSLDTPFVHRPPSTIRKEFS